NGTAAPTAPAAPTTEVAATRKRRRPAFTPSLLIQSSPISFLWPTESRRLLRASTVKRGREKIRQMVKKTPSHDKVITGYILASGPESRGLTRDMLSQERNDEHKKTPSSVRSWAFF